MTALTADRNTPRRELDVIEKGVAAATRIYGGGLTCINAAGNLVPGSAAANLVAVGRAEESVDNTSGAAGDLDCRVRHGVFRWGNSASADGIDIGDIGETCFIVDDQTVARTDGGGARSPAGTVVDVDSSGVWVATGIDAPAENRVVLGIPTITISNRSARAVTVRIQLTDRGGEAIAHRQAIEAYLSDDANGDSIAARAPARNVAIGTDGLLIPVVTNKAFKLVSEADGDIDLLIGENAAGTRYLVLVMPDGRLVVSDAITFT